MYEEEFLTLLRKKWSHLPQDDQEERVTFYREMIEDRIEEGLSEEEAVSAVGSVDEITAQAVADRAMVKPAEEPRQLKRRLKAWEIVFLALGSPLWLLLAVAAFAVLLSLYLSLWSVILSLWTVVVSLIGCSFCGLLTGIVFACGGKVLSGVAMMAAGLVLMGLFIIAFLGCKATTRGLGILTKKTVLWIKNGLTQKEGA